MIAWPIGAAEFSVARLACELQRDWARPEADRLRFLMREYFGNQRTLKAGS